MRELWAGDYHHIGERYHKDFARCHQCGQAPAYVYLQRHILCGVCWHRVQVLRAVEKSKMRGNR